MVIREINFNDKDDLHQVSVLDDIRTRKYGGYVVRNFLDKETLKVLKNIFENYPNEYFEPYDGFESLPRPFNFIFKTNQEDWKRECDYMYRSLKDKGVLDLFSENIRQITGKTRLVYSSPSQTHSFSKSWSSIRRLAPNKGMFGIHCGRLFQEANTTFYNYFRNVADVDMQMVFLIIVDKPDSVESDIDIYDAHWEDYGKKIDEYTLASKDGTQFLLKDIACHRVKLNPGDVLFFDEGNYWHAVPEFSGDRGRISFGGFMTQYKHENTVQIWV